MLREKLKGRLRVYEWMYILKNVCVCVRARVHVCAFMRVCVCVCFFPINIFILCKILFMVDSVSKVINIVP
jgi:hypothetical protein